MAAAEYKVIKTRSDDLERELNTLVQEGWRPIQITPASFGGASFMNSGPSRVDDYCVILQRGEAAT